jgi:hypothetical protein
MPQSNVHGRRIFRNVGSADGSIIATIMASHINRKLIPEAAQVWPGMRIHIMDIVQPPGISISQHIERQKLTVTQTLATNAMTQAVINPTGGAAAPPVGFLSCRESAMSAG